jgi:phage tail-like protein
MDNVGTKSIYRILVDGEHIEDVKKIDGIESVIELRSLQDSGANNGNKIVRGNVNQSGVIELHFNSYSKAAKDLWDWFDEVRDLTMGQVKRRQLNIELLSKDDREAFVTWKVINAWPFHWKGPQLAQSEEGFAQESVLFSYEQIEREQGGK